MIVMECGSLLEKDWGGWWLIILKKKKSGFEPCLQGYMHTSRLLGHNIPLSVGLLFESAIFDNPNRTYFVVNGKYK